MSAAAIGTLTPAAIVEPDGGVDRSPDEVGTGRGMDRQGLSPPEKNQGVGELILKGVHQGRQVLGGLGRQQGLASPSEECRSCSL